VGKPTNVDVAILNANDKHVAVGEKGEVCLKGKNITLGYERVTNVA
jgi:hypothetical protein